MVEAGDIAPAVIVNVPPGLMTDGPIPSVAMPFVSVVTSLVALEKLTKTGLLALKVTMAPDTGAPRVSVHFATRVPNCALDIAVIKFFLLSTMVRTIVVVAVGTAAPDKSGPGGATGVGLTTAVGGCAVLAILDGKPTCPGDPPPPPHPPIDSASAIEAIVATHARPKNVMFFPMICSLIH